MSVTLIATVGSASANTYATEDEAATYFASRLGGEKWPGEDVEKRGQALLTAMRLLERMPFIGQRADTTQYLEWPRIPVRPRERGCNGLEDQRGRQWAATVIPQPIKDAQCEIAYAMILDPSLNDPALIQATLKTDNLSIDHSKPAATRLRMARECLSGLVLHGQRLSR